MISIQLNTFVCPCSSAKWEKQFPVNRWCSPLQFPPTPHSPARKDLHTPTSLSSSGWTCLVTWTAGGRGATSCCWSWCDWGVSSVTLARLLGWGPSCGSVRPLAAAAASRGRFLVNNGAGTWEDFGRLLSLLSRWCCCWTWTWTGPSLLHTSGRRPWWPWVAVARAGGISPWRNGQGWRLQWPTRQNLQVATAEEGGCWILSRTDRLPPAPPPVAVEMNSCFARKLRKHKICGVRN